MPFEPDPPAVGATPGFVPDKPTPGFEPEGGYTDPVGEAVGGAFAEAMDPSAMPRKFINMEQKLLDAGADPEFAKTYAAKYNAELKQAIDESVPGQIAGDIRDVVTWVSEKIDKPFNALRGGVDAYFRDQDITDSMEKGWNREKNFTMGRLLYDKGVLKDNPWARSALGFAMDVAIDPTLALGGPKSAWTKVGQAKRAAYRTGRLAEITGRTAENLAKESAHLAKNRQLASLPTKLEAPEAFAEAVSRESLKAKRRLDARWAQEMGWDKSMPEWRDMPDEQLAAAVANMKEGASAAVKKKVAASDEAARLAEFDAPDLMTEHNIPGFIDPPTKQVLLEREIPRQEALIQKGLLDIDPQSEFGQILAKLSPEERLPAKTVTERAARGEQYALSVGLPFSRKWRAPVPPLIQAHKWMYPVADRIIEAAGANRYAGAAAKWLADTWQVRMFDTELKQDARAIARMTLADELSMVQALEDAAIDEAGAIRGAAEKLQRTPEELQRQIAVLVERRIIDDNGPRAFGGNANLTAQEYERALQLHKEYTQVYNQLTPGMQEYARAQARRYDQMIPELEIAGVETVTKLDDEVVGYIHHLLTREAKDWLKRTRKYRGTTNQFAQSLDEIPGFAKRRKWRRQDVLEINDQWKNREAVDFDLFETDPAKIRLARELGQLKTLSNQKMLDAAKRAFGKHDKEVAREVYGLQKQPKVADLDELMESGAVDFDIMDDGSMQLAVNPEVIEQLRPDFQEAANAMYRWSRGNPNVGDQGWRRLPATKYDEAMWVPSEVLDEMAQMRNRMAKFTDSVVARGADFLHKYWSRWLLLPNPAYHFRNHISNIYLNYMGGISPWDTTYMQAGHIQRTHTKAEKLRELGKVAEADKLMSRKAFVDGATGKPVTYRELIDDAIHDEVYNTGAWARGVPGMEDAVKRQASRFTTARKAIDWLPSKGAGAAQMIENNARLTHYMVKRKRGLDRLAARDDVVKYLFDYGDLSYVERSVGKRLMPFYTWTRKALPLMVESVFTKPKKVVRFQQLKQEIEDAYMNGEPLPVGLLDEWVQGKTPVQTGKGERPGELSMFMIGGYLPIAELNRLAPDAMLEEFVNMLTPLLKVPVEQAANIDLFRSLPRRKWESIEKGVDADLLGMRVNARLAHLLRNVPMVNNIDRFNPQDAFGETGVPREDGSVRRRIDPSNTERWVQFMTGARLYKRDMEKARINREFLYRSKIAEQRRQYKIADRAKDAYMMRQASENIDRLNAEMDAMIRQYEEWLPKLDQKTRSAIKRAAKGQ